MRLLIIAFVLMFSGCTAKITYISICPEVEENGASDIYIDTTGSQLTTTTDQKADGKLDANLTGL